MAMSPTAKLRSNTPLVYHSRTLQLQPATCRACPSRCSSRANSPARHIACSSSSSNSASSSSTATVATDTRTATVQVDLGYAAEQAVVRLTQPSSKLVEATMQFPLGLVLENVDDEVVVTEVTESSAAAAADCRVGDVVRATTAFTMQMTFPTAQLLFGGGGVPKLMKVLIAADKVPFSKVMAAVRSNTADQGGDGSVTLVLERVDITGSNGGSNGSSSSSNGVQELAMVAEADGADGEAVFDPRLFNSHFD